MKAFKAPKESLGDLDAETAATVIATAADIALVLDGDGVIQDVAFQQTDLSLELAGFGRWFGRPLGDTVTAESHAKVETLLREAIADNRSSWRQLNHHSPRGIDIPILYAAVQLPDRDKFVVLGRDLRAVATLQQKLVEAQMSMERDYARLRHVETRYRLLFQRSSEPALVIDAATQKIAEANPAAIKLLEHDGKRLLGRTFPEGFDAASTPRLQALIANVRSHGRGDDVQALLAHSGNEVLVCVAPFRQETNAMMLIRLLPAISGPGVATAGHPPPLLQQLAERTPDGLVVTDRDGRILSANAAFAEMAQLAGEEQARGEALERWFGRPGVDLNVVMANLRQQEAIRLFATTLRGEYGASTDIEVSAVPLAAGANFGFAIRNVGRRLSTSGADKGELPRSAAQLTELIGRVPLKEIVRETTDVIERLCIETALNLTGDNRASAAEMLGLSRQSLYVKLHRYELTDLPPEDDLEDQ